MSSAGQGTRLVSSMEGPDGAPVLILANPIGTTRAIWDAQARVLRQDHRLLRFELRGHGPPGAQSDAPPGPYSIAELGTDPAGYAGCAAAIAAMDLRPALGAIKAPTLVIAGAEDQAAPPWQGAMTASGITDARLRVIRGTSHLAPYQTPGPVTAAILSHLGVPEKLR